MIPPMRKKWFFRGMTGAVSIGFLAASAFVMAALLPAQTDETSTPPTAQEPVSAESVDKISVSDDPAGAPASETAAEGCDLLLASNLPQTALIPGAASYFWNYYDSLEMDSWILMGNSEGAPGNLDMSLSIADMTTTLDDLGAGPGVVPPGQTLYYISKGLAGGPAIASSLTGEFAITSQRSLFGDSFEEVLGTDMRKASRDFFWSWYDMLSPGFQNWIVVNNPDPVNAVEYNIRIAGEEVAEGIIPAGGLIAPTFPGRMGGPVEVVTNRDVLATQRIISDNGKAFSEMPGIPAEDLSDDYLWTWYDNQSPGYKDWVLIANPHPGNAVDYEIKIGGATRDTGSIPAGGVVTPSFDGAMDGPVEVITTGTGGGSGMVIATQRVIAGPSFGEVPGYPVGDLSPVYYWSWYDMTSGFVNWVLISNPDPDNAVDYTIKIDGDVVDTGSVPAGGMVTPTFPGRIGGPVEVTATGEVMASQRVTYNGHFNETLGQLPMVDDPPPEILPNECPWPR